MTALPARLLGPIVNLRDNEATTSLMMFAYSFLAMTAYNIVRPITKAKFIGSLGADDLPYVELAAGVVIGIVMHLYSHGVARLPRRWVISGTQGVEAALLGLFWVLFRTDAAWVSVAFFVLGRMLGILLISQFWTLANDIYDARQAKRVFGFIGGGSALGGATGAGITAFVVQEVGTDNLLLVSAATLTVCLVLVTLIVRRYQPKGKVEAAGDERAVGGGEAIRLLRSSRHLQAIATVIGFAAIGAAIIDQQLNMAVESIKGAGSTDEITAFLGQVAFYMSIAGFVVQVGLTSWIHHALGLGFALLVLPVSLGTTATIMLFNAALWAPALARGLDSGLRYTIDKTTREILFLPLPADVTHGAKPFVDVTVDRFAKALGALLLLVLIKPWGLNLDWQQLGYASLTITALWIGLAIRARREYRLAFRRSIETRTVEPASLRLDVADAATIETLVSELSEPDEARVLYAIEMLETLDKRNLITPLLLHHESPKVRARSLLALESARPDVGERWTPAIERLLRDDDAGVRAAAVRALAALRKEATSAVMRPHLYDPEPRVAATAAAVLADAGNEDDARAAESALKRLTGDTRAAAARARQEAAAALGQIKNPDFRALLLPLISDGDLDVARTALRSAQPLGQNDALFLPALIALLGHRVLKPVARDVLASYGEYFLDALEYFLKEREEDVWVRRHIPATVAAIPTQRSMDILVGALDEPDGFLRFKVIEAIERLRREHPELAFERSPLEALVLKETSRYYNYLTLRYNVVLREAQGPRSLLLRALDDKLARTLDRMYRLLGLIYPWKDIAAARHTIAHGTARARAGAIEYLDNLLGGTLRRRVLPILEDTPMEDKVRRANLILRSRPRDLDDTLAQLVHDDDPVVAATAIHFIEQRGLWTLVPDLEYALAHAAPGSDIAEAAAWALAVYRLSDTRRRGWMQPLPVVELANRLRDILLFDFVSVDELFRIAGAGRQVRHETGRDLYAEGAQPSEVQFLLEGQVRLSADHGGHQERTAPAALAFEQILEGSPLPHTIRAVDRVICLTLGGEQFLTMLSDNIVLAQGLFRMLLEAPAAERWRTVHMPPPGADLIGPRSRAMQPLEKAILLKQNPLLARATVSQLLDVAAIAREIPLDRDSVLFTESDRPAIYHVLRGVVRLEADGTDPIDAGPRATIGVAETVAGVSIGRRAQVIREGHALRIDRQELLEVLADHIDLLQGIFSGLLRADQTESSDASGRSIG